MKIIGIDAVRGERVIVEFGSVIQGVTELIDLISGEPDYVAPGFIDLQVNGYGGWTTTLRRLRTRRLGGVYGCSLRVGRRGCYRR